MAAGTLINLTNFITGIALNETGINISDLKISVEPEFITPVMDNFGHMKGKVVGQPKSTISIGGEVSGSTGIMAATGGFEGFGDLRAAFLVDSHAYLFQRLSLRFNSASRCGVPTSVHAPVYSSALTCRLSIAARSSGASGALMPSGLPKGKALKNAWRYSAIVLKV